MGILCGVANGLAPAGDAPNGLAPNDGVGFWCGAGAGCAKVVGAGSWLSWCSWVTDAVPLK